MSRISVCSNSLAPPPASVGQLQLQPIIPKRNMHQRHSTVTAFSAKSDGFLLNSILHSCRTRGGQRAIECLGCKLASKVYWSRCFDCQGFGLKNFQIKEKKDKSLKLSNFSQFQVHASQSQGPREGRPQRAPPGVDTRIHWDNQDEGWIGGNNSKQQQPKNLLGESFADLLTPSLGSHYEFVGVSPDADLEEIKAAYRRLSKEYHPDTTSLPLKTASEKFMKLREVYYVLSNEESRRFYDWTLAQEAASRQAEKMKMRLEDPYEQQVKNWESVPDMVDRLGGKNMKLNDQAVSAITIDVFIIIFAICCIIYVLFFKEPYY